jgi:cyclic pyranopterin phosphate synthase
MLLAPTGKAYPCCYHFGYSLGDVSKGYQALWNGKSMQKLRQEFLDGKPRTCRSRMHHMQCHRNFPNLMDSEPTTAIRPHGPRKLDVRLGGRCNLRCVMCDVWQQPNGLYRESFLWQDGPEQIFPFLKEVEIMGGEPFIQSDVYRLIRTIAAANPKVAFSFVTNGHYPGMQQVLEHLSMIRLKKLHVSLDAMDPATYSQIRQGGDWHLVSRNLASFIDFRDECRADGRNFELTASFCALIPNWSEVPEFLRFCRRYHITPELQFAFYDPSQTHSLWQLPTNELRTVKDSLLKRTHQPDKRHLESIIRPIEHRLSQAAQP